MFNFYIYYIILKRG